MSHFVTKACNRYWVVKVYGYRNLAVDSFLIFRLHFVAITLPRHFPISIRLSIFLSASIDSTWIQDSMLQGQDHNPHIQDQY